MYLRLNAKRENTRIQDYSFKEKESTLSARIEAHSKFSKQEINDWILEILQLGEGEKILDIGCGTGKQAIPYKKVVGNKGVVIASDISEEIINEAIIKSKSAGVEIQFMVHDANQPFDFPDNYFDVISCCFAIYYLKDLEEAVIDLWRLLKPGGRIFLAGPTPQNAKTLNDLHQKVTKKPLPYMPGISRFMSEVLSEIQKHFKKVTVEIFQNPLVFKDTESLFNYYISTGLFINSVKDEKEEQKIKEEMKIEIQKVIQASGEIIVTKEVGGILGIK